MFAGSGRFANASPPRAVLADQGGAWKTPEWELAEDRCPVVFDRGDDFTVQVAEQGIRFLLVSGKPLEEPVARYGPIVINT